MRPSRSLRSFDSLSHWPAKGDREPRRPTGRTTHQEPAIHPCLLGHPAGQLYSTQTVQLPSACVGCILDTGRVDDNGQMWRGALGFSLGCRGSAVLKPDLVPGTQEHDAH
jgi:hypothetical protein